MGTHRNLHLQVARRTAVCARIALAGNVDDLSVVNTGGYVDAHLLGLAHTSLTAAGRTGALDNLAPSLTAGTGGLGLHHAEWGTLLAGDLTAAAALGAGGGAGALFGAAAATLATGGDALDGYLLLTALRRLVKGNDHRSTGIAAATGGIGVLPPSAAAEAAAEDGGENIPDIPEVHVGTAPAAATGAEVGVYARVTKLVVPRLFLRVGQHLIGLAHFLKLGFRLRVTGVQVRVVFFCHLAIGFFDFVVRGALLHP